jgi:catechol 2,3-dioxygenase-like lactoylglutathione lyase family enzyme
MPTTLLSALPAFVVPDVRAAVVHYTDVLGFRVPDHFRDADEFAIVDLAPGQGIHLKRGRGAPVQGAFVLLTPAEQERLAADLGRRGADIRASLAGKPWGMREMTVVDHVGHRLRVAAEDGPGGQPQVWPEIPVADVAAALVFSREVLGFEPIHTAEYQGRMVFAAAGRDGARVHWTPAEISPRNRGRAGIWDLRIEAKGVDALAAELVARGASVVRGPVTTGYGIRELEIAGPDGCTICFGEDLGG